MKITKILGIITKIIIFLFVTFLAFAFVYSFSQI